VLAEYLLQGKSLSQVYDAPAKKVFPKADNGKDWTVANYGDAEQGQLNVVQATMKSSNTAYAQMMQDVGPQSVVELAKEMGISAPLDPYASLVLGTGEVSVLDMAAAYNTLANGGVRVGPYVVDRVTDSSGRVLWQAPTTRTQVLPPDVAAATNWVLNQVVEGGTGKGAKFGQPVAGKTGTTENYGNAWFAGFTCKLTTAVWVGYPDTVRDMTNVHGIKVAGGTFPTTIFNRFMSRAAAGMESCPFDKPQELSAALVGPVTGGTGVSPSGTGVRPPGTGVTTGTGGDGGDGGEGGGTTVPPTSPSTSAPPPSSTPSTTVAPPPSSVPLAPPSGAATGPG
jgi:penicillin-binding protein 1A